MIQVSKRWMAVMLVLIACPAAFADPPQQTTGGKTTATCGPCDWFRWCPDDFCRKPLPPVKCPPCGVCDDYCKKPLPCLAALPCGECDDYCRKPPPCLIRPRRLDYDTCGEARFSRVK